LLWAHLSGDDSCRRNSDDPWREGQGSEGFGAQEHQHRRHHELCREKEREEGKDGEGTGEKGKRDKGQ